MGFFIGDYVYRRHHAPTDKPPKTVSTVSWIAEHVTFTIGR
jgi:hypothetical protein